MTLWLTLPAASTLAVAFSPHCWDRRPRLQRVGPILHVVCGPVGAVWFRRSPR